MSDYPRYENEQEISLPDGLAAEEPTALSGIAGTVSCRAC